jgi:ABC-type transporter Mla MlaB component
MKHVAAKKGQKRKKAAEADSVVVAEAPAAPVVDVPAPAESIEMSAPASSVEAPVASVAAEASPSAIALNSNCTVKDAVALKHSLVALKDAQDAVVIDASAVERVDTATLQLLCAFVRERVGNDREVVWRSPSAAVLEASRLLGVSELLCLPASMEVAA